LLGTGFNSAAGGRLVPALNLGAGGNSFEVLFSSTGVSTKAYYHSAYKLGGYLTWKGGDFFINSIDGDAAGQGSGEAQLSFSGQTIAGCKIVLTDKAYESARVYVGLVTHELGHCVGLEHPQETV
jgi:hypothetical protein